MNQNPQQPQPNPKNPINSTNPTNTSPPCRRCGTCCRKGGPALHLADEQLVTSGRIPLKHLFTIRQGQPASDNVRNIVAPAPTDIIKIKSSGPHNTTCRYYTPDPVGCTIYAHRPLECRLLNCRDTRAIEQTYNQNRLTRAHLLQRIPHLADLVAEHQNKCDPHHITTLIQTLKTTPTDTQARHTLNQITRFDHHLRQLTIEKTNLDPELLDFFFGTPLSAIINRGTGY
ncbi:YkgJ family cysteine cluster protein [Desulfatitalea alkaliphila]|uniref:YkgJ family cysteine cluster protein n=1 Tax=Desulfatitalea alkaliphila TaxID=2929485 RepID=A0AA41R7S8_9BACT|nr:YkgJ family cysteine cluster protein [Desulfatitalea alkaliphila]MCJ8502805.1 YkgJ family cysteine cluster protein [Desulfatitalea alkaliphila]